MNNSNPFEFCAMIVYVIIFVKKCIFVKKSFLEETEAGLAAMAMTPAVGWLSSGSRLWGRGESVVRVARIRVGAGLGLVHTGLFLQVRLRGSGLELGL